ncbi:MAG: hypothetical protein SU899_03280 [Chloroflexota bacterium]|nr:hypothetical protein [Chloroflexota bacterium]
MAINWRFLGTDMMSKHKRHSVLLLGLALLLASSLMACAEPVPSSLPAITVGPANISFEAQQGRTNLASQTLSVWNSGGGTLTWAASDNADWLILSPSNGSSTGEIDNISIAVDMSGIDAGSYAAIVTISASGATNTPQTIIVNLTINPSAGEEEEVIDALDTNRLLDIGYNYPEKVVIVEGVIVRTYYAEKSKGQPTFLGFHDSYQGFFTCIIWQEDKQTGERIRDKFIQAFPPNPETCFMSKKVKVTGKIEIYKGTPEIILYDPSQIRIVE